MNVTLFRNRVFAGDQVKMRSLGWALIKYDSCPYKKEEFGYRDTCRGKRPDDDEDRDQGDAS